MFNKKNEHPSIPLRCSLTLVEMSPCGFTRPNYTRVIAGTLRTYKVLSQSLPPLVVVFLQGCNP